MSQQLWGPALEAEVAYRREMAAKAYPRKSERTTPWAGRAWRQARAWVAAKQEEHSSLVATRTRDASARVRESLDTVAAGVERKAGGQQISDRGIFRDPLDALRPLDHVERHVA